MWFNKTFGLVLGVNPLQEVASRPLFTLRAGGLELDFTNHMFMVMLSALVLMAVLPLGVRNRRGWVPHGFTNLLETICLFLREDVVRPFLKERTDRYIEILWTLFFFILTMNLLGLIPVDYLFWFVTGLQVHFGGAATANLFVTGALALVSFVLFHAAGIREKGFWHYWATLAPKVPWPLMPFLFLMELLSTFVRMFSLAIRLFANILAGHLVLTVILMFIVIFKTFLVAVPSVLTTLAMSFLEIFVAFLQAYIFVFLTTIFIGFAISEEH
ncbi:MAG: F0F1 ATP synthase subunit A [Anaerohalosphaeraceae bacterium]